MPRHYNLFILFAFEDISDFKYGLCFEQVLMYSPDGRCLFKYSAYDNALGLKTVAWSPCGQFLGCGSYDQVVRALNHLTFKPVAEFSHPFAVKGPSNAVIFKVSPQLVFHSNERFSEFAKMVDQYEV